MAVTFKCLFCQVDCNQFTNFFNEADQIGTHLSTFFIVTKLLGIPEEKCEQYLKLNDGLLHPGCWFQVCGQCSSIVGDGLILFKDLTEIKKKLENVRKLLRSIIKDSEGTSWKSSRQQRKTGKVSSVAGDIRRTVIGTDFVEDVRNANCKPLRGEAVVVKNKSNFKVEDQQPLKRLRAKKGTTESVESSNASPCSQDDDSGNDSDFKVSLPPKRSRRNKKQVKSEAIIELNTPSPHLQDNDDGNDSDFKVEDMREPRRSGSRRKKVKVVSETETTNTESDVPSPCLQDCDDNESDPDFKLELDCPTSPSQRRPAKSSKRPGRWQRYLRPSSLSGTQRPSYECDLCGAIYKYIKGFKAHMACHKQNTGLPCPYCKILVGNGRHFIDHCNKFHPTRTTTPFYCDHCRMIFLYPGKLVQHVSRHHQNAVAHSCQSCEATGFMSKQLLELHCYIEHGVACAEEEPEGSFNCDHCPASFTTKSAADYHLAKDHPEKLLVCQECNKSYTQYFQYEHHRRMVHDNEFLPCPKCPATFRGTKNVQLHMRSHHPEVPDDKAFVCSQCGVRFPSEKYHNDHVEFVHKKVKQLCCDFCGKTFSRKCDLRKHILLHTAPKEQQYKKGPFFCQFCESQFNVRQALFYHMKRYHGEKYSNKCNHCGTGYATPNTLLQHLRKCKRKLIVQDPPASKSLAQHISTTGSGENSRTE